MLSCPFCQIINRFESDLAMTHKILFEDDQVLIMLDQDWAVAGHCLPIWKKHVTNLMDLTQSQNQHLTDLVWETKKILLSDLNRDKSLILKSRGLVEHLHYHLYPLDADISWEQTKKILDKSVESDMNSEKRVALVRKLKTKFKAVDVD